MFKENLVRSMRDKEGVETLVAGHEFLNVLVDVMTDALVEGEEVKLNGFGRLYTVDKEARKGRNPKTGEEIDIEAKTVVRFKCSSILKELINS